MRATASWPGGSTRCPGDPRGSSTTSISTSADYFYANTMLPAINPNTRQREDLEQNHIVRVEQVLAANLGPASIGCASTAPCPLTLAAEYQRTVADSNLAVYDYVRNVWSLTLSWQY